MVSKSANFANLSRRQRDGAARRRRTIVRQRPSLESPRAQQVVKYIDAPRVDYRAGRRIQLNLPRPAAYHVGDGDVNARAVPRVAVVNDCSCRGEFRIRRASEERGDKRQQEAVGTHFTTPLDVPHLVEQSSS